MFVVPVILWLAVPPAWWATFGEYHQYYVVNSVAQREGVAVLAGYRQITDSSFGWLVGLDDELGVRFVRDVPEVGVFHWVLPTSRGFAVWGVPRWGVWDTLLAYAVDTSGNLSPPDTLVFPFSVFRVWWTNDDSLLLLARPDSGPSFLVWWAGNAPADTLPLPSGVHVYRVTVLSDRSVMMVGWFDAPADTLPFKADAWIGRLDRDGTLLWADTLSTPEPDQFLAVSSTHTPGLICAAGMEKRDGTLALYTLSGNRIATYRIGAQPEIPLVPMWEWGEACIKERETWVFLGWKSPGGFPDAYPWMGVVRPSGRVDTVSLDEPWMHTIQTFPPLRLRPWTYVFVRNVAEAGDWMVRIVAYRDTARPHILPLTPDTVMGDTVLLHVAAVDSFSGVDTVEIFYQAEGDSLWQVHTCVAQDTCSVLVTFPPSTRILSWYARAVDQVGNAQTSPYPGAWTVVRVDVVESPAPLPSEPRIRLIPGGLRYHLPEGVVLTVLDVTGRVVARVGDRRVGRLRLKPGPYALETGGKIRKILILP